MRTVAETIRTSRWRWTYAGLFGSFCSIFLAPYNLAGLGPFAMWTLWLLFPFGMMCRPGVLQGLLSLENDTRGALGDERRVAAELDGVAKALLGMQENGLARDLIRSGPQLLREIPLAVS